MVKAIAIRNMPFSVVLSDTKKLSFRKGDTLDGEDIRILKLLEQNRLVKILSD